MKAFYLAAVVVGAMSVAVAQVSPEDHAAHHPDTKKAPPSAAAPSADSKMADMHKRMKSMQELMDKLNQTKDPAERSRLLAQHRQAMHEQLASMQHMGSCMMGEEAGKMGGGDHPGMADKAAPGKGGGGPMAQGMMGGAGMMKCHDMMQVRMDMMTGMMDQMMRHEEAKEATP